MSVKLQKYKKSGANIHFLVYITFFVCYIYIINTRCEFRTFEYLQDYDIVLLQGQKIVRGNKHGAVKIIKHQ
jgi:hypothetical protein